MSGVVTVEELIGGVSAALDREAAQTCRCFDANHDDAVSIDELVAAVVAAMTGCPTPLGLRFAGPKYRMFPARFIETIDIDGDGLLDLATTGVFAAPGFPSGVHSVSVRRGREDGTFGAHRMYSVGGAAPLMLAVGDLNGDGVPDVATANATSDDVSVLFGREGGTLGDPTILRAGDSPRSLAIGDLNGDRELDIVAANQNSHDVSVFIGLGGGDFAIARHFAVGGFGPRGVHLADVNSDGHPDVLTANSSSWDVSVLFGGGDGMLSAARVFESGPGPYFMAVADFDGNGSLDIATADALAGTMTVLLGSETGEFEALSAVAIGPESFGIRTADLDRDGVPDLVVSYGSNESFFEVLVGRGDGTFEMTQVFEVGWNLDTFVLADTNRDGDIDLVTEDGAIVLGRGDGTFGVPLRSSGSPTSVAVADIDGDGWLDLLAMERDALVVRVGLGGGALAEPVRIGAGGAYVRRMLVVDLDRDGRLDVVTANARSPFEPDKADDVTVLLGSGDGTFRAARNYPALGRREALAVADFNGDEFLDVATVGGESGVSLLFGDQNGILSDPRTEAFGARYGLVVTGDLDADGTADLVVRNASLIGVLLGVGDGTFRAVEPFALPSRPGSMTLADVDGDGVLDLVAGEDLGSHVFVLIGTGDGGFGRPVILAAGADPVGRVDPSFVTAADVDADGIVDVVAANKALRDISIFLGRGDGEFSSPQVFEAWGGTGPVGVADFDGDGSVDLLMTAPEPIIVFAGR